jgi:hypothetical protein
MRERIHATVVFPRIARTGEMVANVTPDTAASNTGIPERETSE